MSQRPILQSLFAMEGQGPRRIVPGRRSIFYRVESAKGRRSIASETSAKNLYERRQSFEGRFEVCVVHVEPVTRTAGAHITCRVKNTQILGVRMA